MNPIVVAVFRDLRPWLSASTVRELYGKRPKTIEGWIERLAMLEGAKPHSVRLFVLERIAAWCKRQKSPRVITRWLATISYRLAAWCICAVAEVAITKTVSDAPYNGMREDLLREAISATRARIRRVASIKECRRIEIKVANHMTRVNDGEYGRGDPYIFARIVHCAMVIATADSRSFAVEYADIAFNELRGVLSAKEMLTIIHDAILTLPETQAPAVSSSASG